MNEDSKLILSSSPHFHGKNSTARIMLDVIIALCPALIAGIVFFGFKALVLTLVSVTACVFFEWAYRKLMKLDCTIGDLSAVVTGMLIAMICPPSAPWWMVVIGDLFAIVLVKQLFGGIGKNFMNPALAARAFLFISWASVMTAWSEPCSGMWALDAVSGATPMGVLKDSIRGNNTIENVNLLKMFIGCTGGCIGETCAPALILGGIYLVIRKVITPRIPAAYIATVALIAFVFPKGGSDLTYRLTWCGAQVLGGGLLLGAIFMATDYVTSPVTGLGQILYGIGCGLVTIFIRYFGAYPEAVTFAVLLMNACSGIFDRAGRLKRFGAKKEGAAK